MTTLKTLPHPKTWQELDAIVDKAVGVLGMTRDWLTVARYRALEDGDGVDVEIDVHAMPARFYRIRTAEYSLTTGSGCEQLAHMMAHEISRGMLGLQTGGER